MRVIPVIVAMMVGGGLAIGAQDEKPVPKDSARVSIAGCAYNRSFLVSRPPEGEPLRSDIEPGRRFRLNAKKEIQAGIDARKGTMLEVTGLIRRSDLEGPGGVALGGGRVRIGAGRPQAPTAAPGRDIGYREAIIDVEAFRVLPASCEDR